MNKKIPELRFKGFTEDWEERKLGELSNIVGGGTPSTSNPEYWDGDIDWYAPAEIGEQSYVSKSKKTITELGLKKSSARILPVGTVLFTSRAGIGNTAILAKEATTNQGFQSIVPDQNKLDSYFIFSRTNELKRYGEVTGAGSTFVEVSGKQMSKMSIMVPELSEQQKIGSFFKQLDDTIVLHQRKLDLLKEQKKGFLQKMFPKNSETVPELRFSGFTNEWEQRKLGDEVRIVMGQSPNSENYTDDPNDYILVQGNADMKNGRVLPRVWTTQVTKQAEKDDLILSVRAPVGDIGKTAYDVVIGRGVAAIKGNEFIFQNLGKMKSDGYWTRYSTGSTFESINSTDIKEAIISVPAIEEQDKIGSFFKQLDDTIALHQRKLDLLKEQKKGYLQKMFI
ncbi:restriction endonuclease subunit S [Brochothrix thermosphacta]|uniref:restriction endonuclease subunit S n=1 Tax=Brochothrix thermosphacta TaxID=2756 RepID=UPI000E7728D2|nr:restriction endonuclease subunit S [Brochothrix thermosphacta]ANZ96910.1 restriction endonuclease subunit S [Brochothrix thermosphacta]